MPVANEWGWVATGELIGCWGRRPVAGGTLCVRDATNWGARTTGELLGASAAGGGDSPGEGSSRHGFNGKIPHTVVSCAPCAARHVLHAVCCMLGRPGRDGGDWAIWAAEVSLWMGVGRWSPGLG